MKTGTSRDGVALAGAAVLMAMLPFGAAAASFSLSAYSSGSQLLARAGLPAVTTILKDEHSDYGLISDSQQGNYAIRSDQTGVFSKGEIFGASSSAVVTPSYRTMGAEADASASVVSGDRAANVIVQADGKATLYDRLSVNIGSQGQQTQTVLVTFGHPTLHGSLIIDPSNSHVDTFRAEASYSIDMAGSTWKTESALDSRTLPFDGESGSLTFAVQVGVPTAFSMTAEAYISASLHGDDVENSFFQGKVDYGQTYSWGGITSITALDGGAIGNWTVTSESGLDWIQPSPSAVPENATSVYLGLGLPFLFLAGAAKRQSVRFDHRRTIGRRGRPHPLG